MKTKCPGCGAKIQTIDKGLPGYIKSEVYLKNPDNFYCERCYNLLHYGKHEKVSFSEKDFEKHIKKINEEEALVVNIIDAFDLEGTIVENLNALFPKSKIIIAANKFDLFLSSVNPMRIKNYISAYLKTRGVEADEYLVISGYYKENIRMLLNKISYHQDGKNVYFFGVTNVGKSTLINQIIAYLERKEDIITVDATVGTTLDLIKIPFENKTYLLDTPGLINDKQITYYLNDDTLNLIMNKKYVKPTIFQLNPKQTLFLAGFARIDFLEGERSSFVVYASNRIVLHRSKLENADSFYEKHNQDILLMPTTEEIEKMGKLKTYAFNFEDDQKIDISISGLGFVSVSGRGRLLVHCFEKIKVSFRDSII